MARSRDSQTSSHRDKNKPTRKPVKPVKPRGKRTTSNDPSDQRKSRQLGLPAELRNRVYHYVFEDTTMKLRDPRRGNNKLCLDAPGLLVTCKQIHSEALGIYYSNTTFEVWYSLTKLRFKPEKSASRLPEFLRRIGQEKADLIRNIHLNHPSFDSWGYKARRQIIARARLTQSVLGRARLEIRNHARRVTVAKRVLKPSIRLRGGELVHTSKPNKVRDEILAKLDQDSQ